MTCRLLLSLAVVFTLVVPGERVVSAQGSAELGRIPERQFLLYALEDLSRRPVVDTNRPGRLPEPPAAILGRFAAEQRLVFDTLRRHVQKRKSESLPPLFESYEKELNLLDEFRKALDKSWLEYNKRMAAASSLASSRVLMSGLSYALASASRGSDDRTTLASGLDGMFNRAIVEGAKLRAFDAAAKNELTTGYETAKKQFAPRWDAIHKEFERQFEDFVAENKTETDEFAFQKPEIPERNPFLLTRRAGAILNNKEASVKELMEQVEVCRRAAARVPMDRVYNVYRAAFLGLAGAIANRAAAKDLGATGFPAKPKDAPAAAKQSLKIWNAYIKLEPFDTNYTEEVVHNYILACAQAGFAGLAQGAIVKTVVIPRRFGGAVLKPGASARPEFWFDCARVCSTGGNTRLSLACLHQAVRTGFRDNEAAKIHPDLRNVREDSGTSSLFQRLFR